jgi:hypothetical protein
MAYEIEFSADAREHIRSLKKRDQAIIIDAVADQLTHQPNHPTTHRKPLEDNQVAPWELRVGDSASSMISILMIRWLRSWRLDTKSITGYESEGRKSSYENRTAGRHNDERA